MLEQILPNDVFSLVLVFARIGGAIMLLPGFGEVFVPRRVRLLLALAVTLVVSPLVVRLLPPAPDGPLGMFAAIGAELVIGIFLGALARMMVSALHIAGVIAGYQTSLANAVLFDPMSADQGSLIGSLLHVMGVFVIFAANLHHLMIGALVESYHLFQPGAPLPVGDLSDAAVRVLGQSFALGMQIAAPFIVSGMLFYLGLGLLARLMPQVQVFFIAIPIQIGLGLLVLALTLSAVMMWFMCAFQNTFQGLLLPR
jgi:flagellar biosynthetic protein FliR